MGTIVVIEDQTVLATAYRAKFKAEGFNVEVALDGEQGWDLIKRIKPDLVLLDLQLPKLSGLEILKRARADVAFKQLPMIVFSNVTKPEAIDELWAAGATLILSKFNTSPKRVLESVRVTLANAETNSPRNDSGIDAGLASAPAIHSTNQASVAGHVLLIEDHTGLGALLAYSLNRAGHQVIRVASHAAALEQMQKQSFDGFVLSRECANGDGLSVCRQLRQSLHAEPIIMYSTAALFSEQQEGLKAGATAYLAKPEDLFNLGGIVSDLLRDEDQVAPIVAPSVIQATRLETQKQREYSDECESSEFQASPCC